MKGSPYEIYEGMEKYGGSPAEKADNEGKEKKPVLLRNGSEHLHDAPFPCTFFTHSFILTKPGGRIRTRG